MATIFTKIVNREIPCYKLAEDDKFLAFLDINPLAKGHSLVIPKKEVNYIFDMEDKELSEFHLFAKKVAKAIDKTIACKRIGIAVIGLEVPHAHIHLVPINEIEDLSFSNPKLKFTQDEFTQIAKDISANL